MSYEIIINITATPNQELEKKNIQNLKNLFAPIISKWGIAFFYINAFRNNNVITVSWSDQEVSNVADVFPEVFNTVLTLQSDILKFEKGTVSATVELNDYNECLCKSEEQPEGTFIRRIYNIIKFKEINKISQETV